MSFDEVSISAAGLDLPTQLFVPQQNDEGKLPALVLLHDFFGPDAATQKFAGDLSALGLLVLVPNLFARSAPKENSDEAALQDFAQSLSDAQLVGDALSAVNFLAQHENVDAARLGILGFGWSGAIALMSGAHDSRLRAIGDIGGEISYPVLTSNRPGSPLNFVADIEGSLFAAFAGQDPLFSPNEIERLKARIIEHDKRGEVKIYDAPRRFWRDETLPQTQHLQRRLANFLLNNLIAPENADEPLGDYPNEESRLHA